MASASSPAARRKTLAMVKRKQSKINIKTGSYSLFMFHSENPLRVICADLGNHPLFEKFIVFLILLNCGRLERGAR